MNLSSLTLYAAALVSSACALRVGRMRLQLSKAKHRSLHGHARMSQRFAKLVPFYEYGEERFFSSDDAPAPVVAQRRSGFARLSRLLQDRAPETIRLSEALESDVSDLRFTTSYRVPFPYAGYVKKHLKVGAFAQESCGVLVRDLDGNLAYDLTGSYGVNVFGYDFYKECIDAGIDRVRTLGPVLGSYHPIIDENVRKLKEISGLDEVSFHMSGTEAVMQAVRLARYHTARSHLVRFCGAYHGWWDSVQPGVGNPRPPHEVYTLKEMDEDTLRVLRTRRDIACVLVNPLQALHPNSTAPGDATLISSDRQADFDRPAYTRWLQQLREVCTTRSIVLIFDEVFVGFRIAYGGAQEYFGVSADMVTYGKTLGGGLPVGVLCGTHRFMKRFRQDRPSDVCFARGTFNSHPYVMAAMNEFLRRIDEPVRRDSYRSLDSCWNARAHALNRRLIAEHLPVRVANLSSIWTICYRIPSRYNWMFQYYLRAEGLALSWVGSGRLIFSHIYSDADFTAVADRLAAAARMMKDDGWWWQTPALTNTVIKRRVLREMVAARFPWLL
ncbi:MAG TPA: aminotransferase class III-fold pyridoxal phosphate-dependent enzyme [Vicinamibacterales bacterium]|nr:aminotransferase class III-fold pyridoxal phosphate-dependent enzyme [Vicinamibacterales bacterium]